MPFPGTQQIQIAFHGGLQSKVAKFSLDQPNLEDAINCRTTVEGQIQKRAAFTALPRNVLGGGVISNGAAIQTFNGELLVFDGRYVYSWSPDQSAWINKGSAFSIASNEVRILNTKIATQSETDAATASGLTIYTWLDNRTQPAGAFGIRYSITDNVTSALMVSDALLWASGSQAKVVPFRVSAQSDSWLVVFTISASQIYSALISTSRPTAPPTITPLAMDGQPLVPGTQSIPYDIWCVGGAQSYFAYASTTGLSLIGTGPSSFQVYVTNTTDIQVVSVNAVGNLVWVVWSNATTTFARPYLNGSPLAGVAIIQQQPSINIALARRPSELACVCEVGNAGGNYLNAYFLSFSIAGFVQIAYQGQQRGLGLASKCFTYNGDTFVNAVWPSSLQGTYFTLCLTSPIGSGPNPVSGLIGAIGFEVVAKYGDGNAGGLRTAGHLSTCLPYLGPASWLFAGQRRGAFTSYQGSTGSVLGIAGYSATFATSNAFNSVTSSNNLHITGGVKKIYDGTSVVEDNFHVFPELLSLPSGATFPAAPGAGTSTNPVFSGQGCSVTLSAGGGLEANSPYQYCIVYEWTDNFGQVQRSGPSVPTLVQTDGANFTAILTIPTLRFTDKMSARAPVSIAIYRTQAALPIFYKITNDAAPLTNDPTKDFVTYVDNVADGPPVNFASAGISSNENLYTGSQLPNTAPPECSLVSLFQNRLVVNQGSDPNVVWYSQNKFDLSQYNTLPLDWNTSFVEGIDSRGGGEVTALGPLDAALAIYKPTTIFILSGAGPNTFDTSGEFGDAALVVSDVGCTNQNSLVVVPQTPSSPGGLLFKSAKGIYLLGRDTSVTYVGAPVEEYNDLTITSANILPLTNEIVFTTAEGTCLVLNYFFDVWSTWTGLPSVDAVVWENALVLLRADGTAMVEDLTGTLWQDTLSAPGPPTLPYPSTLPGLVLWLTPSQGVAATGGVVSTWTDQSANAFVATGTSTGTPARGQAVAPTINPSSANMGGQPSISIAGFGVLANSTYPGGQYLTIPSAGPLQITGPITIAFVGFFSNPLATSLFHELIGKDVDGTGQGEWEWWMNPHFFGDRINRGIGGADWTESPALELPTPPLLSLIWTTDGATTQQLYANGLPLSAAPGAIAGPGAATAAAVRIARRIDGNCQFTGEIGEIIVTNAYLAPARALALWSYQQAKFFPATAPGAINRVVRTPWIKLDGQLQGYQAVYNALILGQFQGPSILKVDVAYDYNPSIVESTLINSTLAGPRWGSLPVWGFPAGTWGTAQFSNYQFQVNFKSPRCQAIQLTMTDMTPQPSAGSTLNGISLEVLRLPGGMRMPTSNLIKTSGYSR